jgi:flagellar biosynthesis anti-sigma factor FlgM
MKINDLSHSVGQIGNLETAANKQKEEENKAGQATLTIMPPSERVDFSNASVDFSNAAEKMEQVPEERAKKIEYLKMKIANDEYHVDASKVADKIINDTLFNNDVKP